MTITDIDKPRSDTTAVDVAMLILRIGLGATVIQAGLIKAFDFSATVQYMTADGWRLPTLAALMVTSAETLGCLALVFGAVTPLACLAVIAAMLDAWAANVAAGPFWSQPFNVPFLVALGIAAVLFAGPGSYGVDGKLLGTTRWSTRLAIGVLITAFAVAIVTWVALSGTNPIHLATS